MFYAFPLLVGDEFVKPDKATPGDPHCLAPPRRLESVLGVIDHTMALGHTGPCVADVDEDGAKDLVVGDYSGHFHFYRNLGTTKQPRYAAPIPLQAGGVNAHVSVT